jgi:hypothetical protein
MSATAGRQFRAHRMNRRRAVFSYRAPTVDPADAPCGRPDGGRFGAARLARLRTRRPFNPIGATVLRPVGDAANTLSILREIVRGPR